MLLALLGLHAALAAVAPLIARRLGRGVFPVCAVAPLATVAWAVTQAPAVIGGAPVAQTLRWVPGLDLAVTLRLDAFALLFVALVSGIGVLVFAYSVSYFGPSPRLGRFAGTLTAFAGAMLGLVLADNLLVLYLFWELTSITSYLLIGYEHEKGSARAAALQALLVTGGGGLVMLAGFVLLGQAAGTYQLSAILADPPATALAGAGVMLAAVGAFTKSAQVPFHFWLPSAMAAPTPVSTYLHSATMVKAGVYLVARLAPAFALLVPVWRPLVVGVGVATMLVGGYRALRQDDLKRLLAYGTVSQLGFLVALLGYGSAEATAAGVAMLLAHALFKAALFMVVGIVEGATGTRDVRRLSGLGRRLPVVGATALAAGASMAGIPPLFGFVTKELAFEALISGAPGSSAPLHDSAPLALAGIVLGSVLTFAYTARLLAGGFGGRPDLGQRGHPDVHRPGAAFLAPAALLAISGVVLGLLPGLADPLTEAATVALVSGAQPAALALWHGPNLALALSAAVIAAGLLLAWKSGTVEKAQGRLRVRVDAHDIYESALVGLNRVADRVTGVVQSGSLPVYLGVILSVAVVAPGVALLTGELPDADLRLADSWLQLVVVLACIAAACGAATAQRRFSAVLFLGGVGYGVALLFVIHGAPDLALTQVLVETLSIVLFALVLRHLPRRFDTTPWRLSEPLRRAVAGGVGLLVLGFSLVARAARTAEPVSEVYVEAAVPEAGGRNVVNVILVDFRGFDTFGEITVLVVAALGIAALVRAGGRGGDDVEEAAP